MAEVVGHGATCIVLGVGEKNGVTAHHPLNLERLNDLLIVDLDYFLANEAQVRSLVEDALRHRAQHEKGYAELLRERDDLLGRLKELRRLAKDYRVEDRHVCPDDILAITGP